MAAISAAVGPYGAVTVVAANANRRQLWLQNASTSGQVVYLLTGTGATAPATAGNGVRLNPNGGMWTTTGTGWVTAITDNNTTNPNGLVVGWEL